MGEEKDRGYFDPVLFIARRVDIVQGRKKRTKFRDDRSLKAREMLRMRSIARSIQYRMIRGPNRS